MAHIGLPEYKGDGYTDKITVRVDVGYDEGDNYGCLHLCRERKIIHINGEVRLGYKFRRRRKRNKTSSENINIFLKV